MYRRVQPEVQPPRPSQMWTCTEKAKCTNCRTPHAANNVRYTFVRSSTPGPSHKREVFLKILASFNVALIRNFPAALGNVGNVRAEASRTVLILSYALGHQGPHRKAVSGAQRVKVLCYVPMPPMPALDKKDATSTIQLVERLQKV